MPVLEIAFFASSLRSGWNAATFSGKRDFMSPRFPKSSETPQYKILYMCQAQYDINDEYVSFWFGKKSKYG